MKQEIQEKLMRQTSYLTTQANLFNVVVETAEIDIAETMTFDGNNTFRTTVGDKNYYVQSNPDMYSGNGSVITYVDTYDSTTGESRRIADLTTYMNGDVTENYYNPSKEDRRAIFALFGDIEDAVQGLIDGGGTTPNNADGESTIDA